MRHQRGMNAPVKMRTVINSLIRAFGLALSRDEWENAVKLFVKDDAAVTGDELNASPSVVAVANGCQQSLYAFPSASTSLLQTFQSLSDSERGRFITGLCQSLFPFVDGIRHGHAVHMQDMADSDEIFKIQDKRNATFSCSLHYLELLTSINLALITPIENNGAYVINLDYQNAFLIQLYKTLPCLPLIPLGFQSAIEEALMRVNNSTMAYLESSSFVALQATNAIEQVVFSPYKQTEVYDCGGNQSWDPYLVSYLAGHIVKIACGPWRMTDVQWMDADSRTDQLSEVNGTFFQYCDTLLERLNDKLSAVFNNGAVLDTQQGPIDLSQRIKPSLEIIKKARETIRPTHRPRPRPILRLVT